MREYPSHQTKWLLVTICCILSSVTGENQSQTWSKPEKSISAEDSDWIPVEGKCQTCRPNRDLDAQSTNEQINQVLSPPAPLPSRSPSVQQPTPKQPIQFPTNKQPRILPFGSNFPLYNNPFVGGDNKPYQLQSTKLYTQEPVKQFYQYDTNAFIKQPYSLPPQQLIQQAPTIIQQQVPQRFPSTGEPYPFTLPLKPVDTTTPRIAYQPKIRFPDVDVPKYIPNNKITAQNTDEIQLLYVPVETLRGRKNMKDQFAASIPPTYLSSQYNIPYPSFPAATTQPETQFYFPQGYSQAPTNLIQPQLQQSQQQPQILPLPQQQQRLPETIQTNFSKNILQPYFTINGVYNGVSPVQSIPLPIKQQQVADLQFYNLLQAGLINSNQVKPPEQQFKLSPATQVRPGQFDFNDTPLPSAQTPSQKNFALPSNANLLNNVQTLLNDVYTPTTTEASKSTQLLPEKLSSNKPQTKFREFEYQYVTNSPQTSASQNQHYVFEQNVLTQPKQLPQSDSIMQHIPQKTMTTIGIGTTQHEENNSANYPIPHQPPLSFYMEKLHNSKINDVLYLLKDAKTIPVLDTVENEPPQVFVGPSELQPPKGYIKFELPYLSSLDYNRIERMIDRLPFFVAPLNFKPPPGYSKIPFPAPHIGSVVLSNSTAVHEALHGKQTPYEQQKYKPTTPPFTPSSSSSFTQLSTSNPQLTSQINSLVDVPPPSLTSADVLAFKTGVAATGSTVSNSFNPQTFKTYPTPANDITKKVPTPKNTYNKPTTPATEAPKRVTNRQRRPIYRGYPTTTTPPDTTTIQFSSSPEIIKNEAVKDTDNYVEFSAKGTFNINDGHQNVAPSKPSSAATATVDNTYQLQVPSTTIQPPIELDKAFDVSNFFSTFDNQQSSLPNHHQSNQFLKTEFKKQPSQNTTLSFQASPSQLEQQQQQISNTQLTNVQPSSVSQQFLQQFQPPSQFEISQPAISAPSQSFNFLNNENYAFQTSKQQQSSDYFNPNGQNHPIFNLQTTTTNEATTETISNGNGQSVNTTNQFEGVNQPTMNFNNIKPLSQYDPFSKKEVVSVNITEPATISTSSSSTSSSSSSSTNNNNNNNGDNLSYWNSQNQFYHSNPAAVEFFSSPASFPSADNTSPAIVPENKSPSTPTLTSTTNTISSTTYTPENAYVSDNQNVVNPNDYSSTETTEKPSTNTYRSRVKQRIQPNRYHHHHHHHHQSKYTTERTEPIDYQSFRTTTTTTSKAPATEYVEQPNSLADSTVSSTTTEQQQQEISTTKHRRRRPGNKPHQQPATTETTISSTRGYRTRPTRLPPTSSVGSSSTERYRARRPITTTPEAASSDWIGYGSSNTNNNDNFPPSAPAANEITASVDVKPRLNSFDDANTYSKPVSSSSSSSNSGSSQYWSETNGGQSFDAIAASPTTLETAKNVASENDSEQQLQQQPSLSEEPPKVNSFAEYSSFAGVPAAQNQQFFVDNLAAPAAQNNSDDNVAERNDERQFYVDNSKQQQQQQPQQSPVLGAPQTQIFDEVSASNDNVNNRDNVAEGSVYQSEKSVDREEDARKGKFFTKDNVLDGQKKAYDPHDEKKVPGRRRGTWVRRIRIKRPQDVFETAESQNLGRLTDNSLQTSDSKVLSKSEEKGNDKDESFYRYRQSSVADEIVTSTEAVITEREDVQTITTTTTTTTPSPLPPSPSPTTTTTTTTTTTENNEYANLQNNFAQMLSDFLNSNDQSTKTVNNFFERYNATENSISFVLGLDKQEHRENGNFSSNTFIASSGSSSSNNGGSDDDNKNNNNNDGSPAETTVARAQEEDAVTVTNYPDTNTEIFEHQTTTTTEEASETVTLPNKRFGTSTTTEISLETEICYRGKCVKTKKSKASDLLPIE